MEETNQHIPFEITQALIEGLKGMIDSKDNMLSLESIIPLSPSIRAWVISKGICWLVSSKIKRINDQFLLLL